MGQIVFRSFFQAVVATTIVVSLIAVSQAQVMSSSNFKIQNDSVNAGGLLSSSSNYRLEDTAGEVATGNSSSTNFVLKAGYQQMQEVFISMSAITNVVLAPNLPGLTGGTATGSAAFVVTTDSSAGYSATIKASTSPAMRSGVNTIADYVPAGAVPDFSFTTGASGAHFAYSPEGVDVAVRFQDNASVCGIAGGDTTNRCFDGLKTTAVEIARKSSSNQPSGSETIIRFNVGVGGGANVPAGMYEATTTVTATAL